MVSKNKKSVSRGKKVSKGRNDSGNRNILIGVAFVVALLVAGFYIGGYGVTGNIIYDEYGNQIADDHGIGDPTEVEKDLSDFGRGYAAGYEAGKDLTIEYNNADPEAEMGFFARFFEPIGEFFGFESFEAALAVVGDPECDFENEDFGATDCLILYGDGYFCAAGTCNPIESIIPDGQSCNNPNECISGNCVDSICVTINPCEGSVDGDSCNLPGNQVGTCMGGFCGFINDCIDPNTGNVIEGADCTSIFGDSGICDDVGFCVVPDIGLDDECWDSVNSISINENGDCKDSDDEDGVCIGGTCTVDDCLDLVTWEPKNEGMDCKNNLDESGICSFGTCVIDNDPCWNIIDGESENEGGDCEYFSGEDGQCIGGSCQLVSYHFECFNFETSEAINEDGICLFSGPFVPDAASLPFFGICDLGYCIPANNNKVCSDNPDCANNEPYNYCKGGLCRLCQKSGDLGCEDPTPQCDSYKIEDTQPPAVTDHYWCVECTLNSHCPDIDGVEYKCSFDDTCIPKDDSILT